MEKALYLVWWAFRPASCRVCGSSDRWLPSTDDEYQCDHCSSGNGSTRSNEVVEDVPGMADQEGDSSQDENDGNHIGLGGGGAAALGARHGVQALNGAALVSLFCVYLTHLERLPVDVRPPSSVYPIVMRMATELAELVPLPSAGETQLSGKGGYDALASNSAADEDEHPATLIRTASLFIACCVLCPGLVPFPVFMRQAPARNILANLTISGRPAAAIANNQTIDDQSTTSATTGAFACQWMDVAALASNIGLILDDFFDSEGTINAFMTNVMVMVKEYAPSTLAWSPLRDPTRMTYITGTLATRRNGVRSSGRPAAGTALSAIRPKQRFSPEHTAAFVTIELVRCYEGSRAGSSCERLNAWYEKNAPIFLPNFSSSNGVPSSATSSESFTDADLLHTTKWGNLLLWIYANKLFGISALELCELLMASGVFGAPTRLFEVLTSRVSNGHYDMPLQRRLRPYLSPWAALFSALHSEDRLILMSALHLANHRFSGTTSSIVGGVNSANATSKEEQRVIELVQRILRKHGSLHRYQFNYGLRVDDKSEQHFGGNFFCSHVSTHCAIYTCLRSGRKTIAFDGNANKVRLNIMGAKERMVPSIECEFIGPVVASIEDMTAKMVFDLVRYQSHEVEWADAQRRIVARETIKRRLQSGTIPKIALGDLRSILASAAVPMTSITLSCGLVPTGELSGAADGSEGLLQGIFATPNTQLALSNQDVLSNRKVTNEGGSSASKLTRLDQMSMDSAKNFAAAMSGSSTIEPSAVTTPSNPKSHDVHYAATLDLQNRQFATLFRSLERQVYCLPAPELAMGLPVAKQLACFAEHHALCEGPYMGPYSGAHSKHHHQHTKNNNYASLHRHPHSGKKHSGGKGSQQQQGGYASGGSGVDESGGGSDTPISPTVAPTAEEELLVTTIAAVTGARVLLPPTSVSPIPLGEGGGHTQPPVTAATHVSSSTFRLESRFAAELQLRSAIARYKSFKEFGSVDVAEAAESADAARRADRRKKRQLLQQQSLQHVDDQRTTTGQPDPAVKDDCFSPPQKFSAIQKDRKNTRDSQLEEDIENAKLARNPVHSIAGGRKTGKTSEAVDEEDEQVIEDNDVTEVNEKQNTADSQYLEKQREKRREKEAAAAAAASGARKGSTQPDTTVPSKERPNESPGVVPSKPPKASKPAKKREREDVVPSSAVETPSQGANNSTKENTSMPTLEQQEMQTTPNSVPTQSSTKGTKSRRVEADLIRKSEQSMGQDDVAAQAPAEAAGQTRKRLGTYGGLSSKQRDEMAKRRSEKLKHEKFSAEGDLF